MSASSLIFVIIYGAGPAPVFCILHPTLGIVPGLPFSLAEMPLSQ